jgi:hypothetical protein
VNARCKDSAGSSSWAEEVSTKDKLEEIAAAMRARWQGSATAEPASAEVEPGQAEREHQAPISNQPHSPLAGVDLETAMHLRWALRDIKAKRTKLTPVAPINLKTLIEMSLVEMRDDGPMLTDEGHQTLDQ